MSDNTSNVKQDKDKIWSNLNRSSGIRINVDPVNNKYQKRLWSKKSNSSKSCLSKEENSDSHCIFHERDANSLVFSAANSKSLNNGNSCITPNKEPDISSKKDHKSLQKSSQAAESSQSSEPTDNRINIMSREEIVARRKLKVAERKKIQRFHKQQIKEPLVVVQNAKPDFSLELAAEEFPSLNAARAKKKTSMYNQGTSSMAFEESTSKTNIIIEEYKSNKIVEKSWKPKIKDPICINLSQALQNEPEKCKPVTKKANVASQRNVLAGNILDSDNPKRKKGKVRPDKVEKPSKLKSHILLERNERRKKLLESKENNSELCDSSVVEEDDNSNVKHCDSEKTPFIVQCDVQEIKGNLSVCESKQTENSQDRALPNIHSRKFREYCTNCLTQEVITNVCLLLEKVAYFQDRMHAREPIKASAKRRYVAGINQTNKYLQVRKVKLLVIAPDLERNPGEGGLDEKVQYFKKEADCQNIPCVFGPNRKRLGRAVKKTTLVSCVAVLSYEGAEEQYSKVVEALHEAKSKYLKLTGHCQESDNENVQDTNQNVEEETYASASDITSSLLATLREDLAPAADKLLNAISQRQYNTVT